MVHKRGLFVATKKFGMCCLMAVAAVDCTSSSPSSSRSSDPPPDPPGTVVSDIRLSGIGPDGIDFESSKIIGSADGCGESTDLWLDKADNFNACPPGSLVGLGDVRGLGDITSAPTSGYGASTAAILGTGLVVKTPEGHAYRVYVAGETVNALGGVIGKRIKWAALGGDGVDGGGDGGGPSSPSLTATFDGQNVCNLGWSSGPSATGSQSQNQITVYAACSGSSVQTYYSPIPQTGGSTPCTGVTISTTGSNSLSCDSVDGGANPRPSAGTLNLSGSPGSFKVSGSCSCSNGTHSATIQFQNIAMAVQ